MQFEIQAARLGLSTLDGDIAIDDIKINTSKGSENCDFYPPNAQPRNWGMLCVDVMGISTCFYCELIDNIQSITPCSSLKLALIEVIG